MYVRPPENKKIKLPENYRGNAFGTSGEYTDMPPPIRIPHPSYDLPPEDISKAESRDNAPLHQAPAFDEQAEPISREILYPPEQNGEDLLHKKSGSRATSSPDEKSGSFFSSLLPPPSDPSRFPFGHGIGAEELLILAMMLLVFSQGSERGEVDNELIILLALLLFSG